MCLKQKNFVLQISLLIFVFFNSCKENEEDQCILNRTEYVSSVNSPSTGAVNQTINIEVSFPVFNGCGGFGRFIETEIGNSRTIEVEAKYVGCICTQDAPLRSVNYEFTTSNAGDYELNFKSGPTEFITVNLTIN